MAEEAFLQRIQAYRSKTGHEQGREAALLEECEKLRREVNSTKRAYARASKRAITAEASITELRNSDKTSSLQAEVRSLQDTLRSTQAALERARSDLRASREEAAEGKRAAEQADKNTRSLLRLLSQVAHAYGDRFLLDTLAEWVERAGVHDPTLSLPVAGRQADVAEAAPGAGGSETGPSPGRSADRPLRSGHVAAPPQHAPHSPSAGAGTGSRRYTGRDVAGFVHAVVSNRKTPGPSSGPQRSGPRNNTGLRRTGPSAPVVSPVKPGGAAKGSASPKDSPFSPAGPPPPLGAAPRSRRSPIAPLDAPPDPGAGETAAPSRASLGADAPVDVTPSSFAEPSATRLSSTSPAGRDRGRGRRVGSGASDERESAGSSNAEAAGRTSRRGGRGSSASDPARGLGAVPRGRDSLVSRRMAAAYGAGRTRKAVSRTSSGGDSPVGKASSSGPAYWPSQAAPPLPSHSRDRRGGTRGNDVEGLAAASARGRADSALTSLAAQHPVLPAEAVARLANLGKDHAQSPRARTSTGNMLTAEVDKLMAAGGDVTGALPSDATADVAVIAQRRLAVRPMGEAADRGVPAIESRVSEARAEKGKDTMGLLLGALSMCDLTAAFSEGTREKLAAVMRQVTVCTGEEVVRQGEVGERLFIVESGTFDVLRKHKDSRGGTFEAKVALIGPGKLFGELALMNRALRSATVRAKTDGSLWTLSRSQFHALAIAASARELREIEEALARVPILTSLPPNDLSQLVDALEPVVYTPGQAVVVQGDDGHDFFIVKSGVVEVSQEVKEGRRTTVKVLGRYGAGGYFGERALLGNDKRAATVTAVGDVSLLRLGRTKFTHLMGSLVSELRRRASRENKLKAGQNRLVLTEAQGKLLEWENQTLPAVDIAPEHLEHRATLWEGPSSDIELVEHVLSGRAYVIKRVDRAKVAQRGLARRAARERAALAELRDAPCVAQLVGTHKDESAVYLLLPYYPGGDLFSALVRSRAHRLPETTVRFFAAGLVLALEAMARHSIIHRDVRIENVAIDRAGYPVLLDFAESCKAIRSWTVCGAVDCMAPEVVLCSGHTRTVDLWGLGILIYELLHGRSPFAKATALQSVQAILEGSESLEFAPTLSGEATDLISRLLVRSASRRLGAGRRGIAALRAHPWFYGVDWDAMASASAPAPNRVDLSGPFDVSNFMLLSDRSPMDALQEADDVAAAVVEGIGPGVTMDRWDASF